MIFSKKNLSSISLFKYLILLFFVFTSIYLSIPKFYKFDERTIIVKKSLIDNFNIELKNHAQVKYSIFPSPRIVFINLNYHIGKKELAKGYAKKLEVKLNFLEILEFKKQNIKEIHLEYSNLNINLEKLNELYNFFKNLKKKLILKNSNLIFLKDSQPIIKLENADFNNKNLSNIYLKAFFEKKKIKLNLLNINNSEKIKLIIPAIGFNSTIEFDNSARASGTVRIKFLQNNIQFSFFNKKENFMINNSFLRNKFIQTSFDGLIKKLPFFYFDLIFNIKNFDFLNFYENSFIRKTISYLSESKKFNGKLKIQYLNKNFNNKLINKFNLNLILENGDLKVNKSSIYFYEGFLNLDGILYSFNESRNFRFNSLIEINNLNKLLKKLNIEINNSKNNPIKIEAIANLNSTSSKIDIKKVVIDDKNFNKKKRDLLKENIEQLLIEKSIFNYINLKNFLKEIIQII